MGKLKTVIGVHDVTIERTTFTESASGTPGILCSVALVGDPSDRGFVTLWLSEKAKARTLETLKLLGWDAERHDYDFNDLEFNNPLHGARAEVQTEEDNYNGKTSVKIAFLNAPGQTFGKKLEPARRAQLSADFRASMGLPPKAKPAVGSDFPNDEVPF